MFALAAQKLIPNMQIIYSSLSAIRSNTEQARKIVEVLNKNISAEFAQENIKKIRVEGVSGSNSVKIILDGDGEMQKIEISDELLKEDKTIIEDLIVAAFNDARDKIQRKIADEMSSLTGGIKLPPGMKLPF